MKLRIHAALLWAMLCLPLLLRGQTPVLQVSNSEPIMDCNIVHCKVLINNESPLSEHYAVSIDETNLKIVQSNLPKRFDLDSGESLSYDFDFMVKAESPSIMELKVVFESLSTKSVSVAHKTIRPIQLSPLSVVSTRLSTASCNEPVLLLLDKDTELSNDLILQHPAGLTIMAKPEAQLVIAAQLSMQNVAIVACENSWDNLIFAQDANIKLINSYGIKQKSRIKTFNIQIYPNPTQELLNVNYELKGNAQTSILDINGRVVLTKTGAFPMQYDVSALPAANYLIKIETPKGNLFQPFSKIN